MAAILVVSTRVDRDAGYELELHLARMGHDVTIWNSPGNSEKSRRWKDEFQGIVGRVDAAVFLHSRSVTEGTSLIAENFVAHTRFLHRGYGTLLCVLLEKISLHDLPLYWDNCILIQAHDWDPRRISWEVDRRIEVTETKAYDIFLSYSSDDKQLAGEIEERIEKTGLRCFMASKDVRPSSLWLQEIRAALLRSKSVLVLLTPNSKDRRWVLLEAGAAWALGKRLIPALMSCDPRELPEALGQHQAVVIETEDQRRSLVEELAKGKR